MQQYQSLEDISLPDAWLTIGSYDGIHRGHQAILTRMVSGAHAAGSSAVVLTFFPHPGAVLRGVTGPFYLTSTEEKVRLVKDLGVDAVISLPFTRELASVSASDFMTRLKRQLGLTQLWIGYNFTLGRDAYRAQLEAIARELAEHRGPMIVAGDLNTWSSARLEVVEDVMQRLGLVSVPAGIEIDGRSRFLGHQVDHIFVRDLEVVHAEVPKVASSDHNPVLLELRVASAHPSEARDSLPVE
jgi:hypothetical protein